MTGHEQLRVAAQAALSLLERRANDPRVDWRIVYDLRAALALPPDTAPVRCGCLCGRCACLGDTGKLWLAPASPPKAAKDCPTCAHHVEGKMCAPVDAMTWRELNDESEDCSGWSAASPPKGTPTEAPCPCPHLTRTKLDRACPGDCIYLTGSRCTLHDPPAPPSPRESAPCVMCGGRGMVPDGRTAFGASTQLYPCPVCRGTVPGGER